MRAVQVSGVVVHHVPYLGYLNTWVGVNRPGWLLHAVAVGLLLVLARRRSSDERDERDE